MSAQVQDNDGVGVPGTPVPEEPPTEGTVPPPPVEPEEPAPPVEPEVPVDLPG